MNVVGRKMKGWNETWKEEKCKNEKMKGWKDEKMKGWKVERMQGWKNERMKEWKNERMDGRMEGGLLGNDGRITEEGKYEVLKYK